MAAAVEAQNSTFSIASRYQALKQRRSPYEERAKSCAALTIPAAYPSTEEGGDSSSLKFVTPYQAIGAEGVSTLASKLMLALLPPNTPCFRLRTTDQVQQEALQDAEGKEALTTLEKAMGRVEQSTQDQLEALADRPSFYEALLQLIIAGNVLIYLPPDKAARVFRLPHYVVRRDALGSVLEIVTHEKVERAAIPTELEQLVNREGGEGEGQQEGPTEKSYDLYTYVRRQGDKWETWQECQGERVPGSDGTYPLDVCPWLPLRMYRTDGEDYGRSYTEQYLGDLKSLEGLTQAILEGSAMAAKVLFLVAPNGGTRAKVLERSPNGAVVEGRAEDVSVVQVGKGQDFRVTLETAMRLEQRLAKAFLLVDSVRRNAERVTAEEIRVLANELEAALGGVYSILSQEFQRPYIAVRLHQFIKGRTIPALPKGTVKPVIVAGFEALGRGNDKEKLKEAVAMLAPILPPQALGQFINIPDFINRTLTACGVNPDGLIKDQETMAGEQQAAQQSQMQQTMMPKMADMAGKALGNLPPEAMAGLGESLGNLPPEAVAGLGESLGNIGMDPAAMAQQLQQPQ